jgi:hypothetical protein
LISLFDSLGSVLAVAGIGSPLIIFAFLDKYLKKEYKANLTNRLFGHADEGLPDRVSSYSLFLYKFLGVGYIRRALTFFLISILSISFVYSLQYLFNYSSFFSATLPFIKSIITLNVFSIAVFLSFVFVDVVSFYQTLTFARLSASCRNPLEVAFIGLADLALSFLLVIILLPFLIIASHIFTTSQKENSVNVGLSAEITRQNIYISDIIRMSSLKPMSPSEEEVGYREDLRKLEGSGWSYTSTIINATSENNKFSLSELADGITASAGATIFFFKGILTAEEKSKLISKILIRSKTVDSVEVIDSYENMFGQYYLILKITGKSPGSGLSFLKDYKYVLGDVNFFDSYIVDIFEFGQKVYLEDDLTWLGNFSSAKDSNLDTVFFVCDDMKVDNLPRKEFLERDWANCEEAVAMSAASLFGLVSILSYKFEDQIVIPILPTAISSIYLTFVIYLSLIVWIFIPSLMKFADKYLESGSNLVVDNIFKITYAFVLIVFLPIYFLNN